MTFRLHDFLPSLFQVLLGLVGQFSFVCQFIEEVNQVVDGILRRIKIVEIAIMLIADKVAAHRLCQLHETQRRLLIFTTIRQRLDALVFIVHQIAYQVAIPTDIILVLPPFVLSTLRFVDNLSLGWTADLLLA